MSEALFCYGTLLIPAVMHAVTGKEFPGLPARLPSYVCEGLRDEVFPGVMPRPGVVTEGMVFTGLNDNDLQRLDLYEGDIYLRHSLVLELPGGETRTAWVYVLAPAHYPRLSGKAWDLSHFQRRHLPAYLARLSSR